MADKRMLQLFSAYELAQELVLRVQHSNGIEFLTDIQLRTLALACIEEEGRRDGHLDTACPECVMSIKHMH